MSITEYSVKNPIIVNILMVAILIIGTFSLLELPRELNPKVVFNYVFVIVPYPGVGAEEVEKLITIPIEEAVDDIEDIKLMTSESNEGGSFVWLQFEEIPNEQFQERMNEVETAVNGLSLPEGALDPVIDDFDTDNFVPVISISIVGDMPERRLKELSEDLKDDLLNIDGISQVGLTGVRDREIWIEVEAAKLYQHRLSLNQVAAAVGGRHRNVPAGDIVVGRRSYLVRSIGEIESPEGFKRIVVRSDPNGNHLYLGEIASVEDRWAEESSRARMEGQQAATLSITKKASANSLDVIEEARAVADRYRSRLPLNSRIVFTHNTAMYIKDILNKLQTNALLGFLLVVVMLFVFMGLRNALVAAIGIPIAFMATFIFMRQFGQTLNGSSLFGLMLVLGVVVDDAIIVVENCFRHRQKGLSRVEAAITGSSEVFWPVVSATLTTVAAFLPLILMTGIMGKFMRVIPIIVSLTLAASLIEVFLIAPSHFAEWGGIRASGSSRWFKSLRKRYTRLLVWVMRRRYFVGAMVIVLALMLAFLIPLVGVELFSGEEVSQFMVLVTMPANATLDETDRVIRQIETGANSLPDEETHAVIANTGILQTDADWIYGDHVGQVIVDLVEKEFRSRSLEEIMDDLRGQVALIPGPIDVKFRQIESGPPTGKPVEIKVKGKYLDKLNEVAESVKAELKTIPGVQDVSDDNLIGKSEVRLVMDEERISWYGLSAAAVASEIRAAVTGVEAAVFRDGDEEVEVLVRLAGRKERGIDDLRSLPLLSPTGVMLRLDQVCTFDTEPTLFRIKRFEQDRAITVSANVDRRVNQPIAVNREIARRFKQISLEYPGYSLDFRGEFKEFQESFAQLGKLFLLGVLLILTILGAQFKSIRQSLIILLTIPFAFIGSMIGLLVIGNPFSLVTMYGMVALAGIAVNDAIVMVSFINNERDRGVSRWRSIIQAGRIRLRPIILTSMTTILGLMPMATGLGGKSGTWAPLANTIVWGLVVATILTLLVIPTVYTIIVDEWFGWRLVKGRLMKKKL